MIDVGNIMAVARMERRHTRRLVRYWVFIAIAYLFGLGAFLYYSGLHAFLSSISASVGMIGPRYLIAAIGLYYLTGFVLAIVFLGFDVRARDVREGVVEVLDARPLTNLELVAGRFVALFLSAWLPIVVLAVIMQALGLLLPLLGSPVGATIEPRSLLYFVGPMAVPAIAVVIALVFVVTLLVRHRLVAALLCIAIISAMYWALFTLPVPYAPFFDFPGIILAASPSDIVPAFTQAGGWLHRAGVLIVALGLVGLAAVIHPRLDGGQRLHIAAVSLAIMLVGVLAIGQTTHRLMRDAGQVEHWRAVHESRSGDDVAEIRSIEGSVEIHPGRRLDAVLRLTLAAPDDRALRQLLLTLNPGFTITTVQTADGGPLTFTHRDGLLEVELPRPLGAGESLSLQLHYDGRPDVRFGYLDSVISTEQLRVNQAQIAILGYERAIFDRRYVALMPGVHWLPASGVDVGRGDRRHRATDYFSVALDVEVPDGWLVAGPGSRESLPASDGRSRYRFAPAVAVPEVALMAGRFHRVATRVSDITFELLLHPAHTAGLEYLADTGEEIEAFIAERLEVAEQAGLAYPFDAFTVVEVPNRLRGFGGGWRLDTTLAPPAMMLLRETSFPTARFDVDVFVMFGNRDVEQQGGQARVNRNRLVSFFSNDFSGGNLFTGAARSFYGHRTSAVGEGAIALDYALEELATLLLAGNSSYFSAHLFTNINDAAVSAVSNMGGGGSVANSMIRSRTSQPEVWDAVLDTSLASVDPWDDPQRTIDLLTLKGGRMAQALHDTLGNQAVAELLAGLLDRHGGSSFSLQDFVAAGERVDPGLGELFEDWISSTGLPGFIAESAELVRLPDGPGGEPRYQVLMRLSNDEPVVGFTRIAWMMQPGAARTFSDPLRVPGNSTVEFGTVLSAPPYALFVHPYLSLNRNDFLGAVLNRESIPRRDVEPLNGVREVPYGTGRDPRIFVDDLDDGFHILTTENGGTMRLAGRQTDDAGTDHGLPVATGPQAPREWSRRAVESSWGRYRHTIAYVGAGDGSRRAVMPAQLPAAGVWALEIHIPFLQFLQPPARGTWHLEIVSAQGRRPVSYDASIANTGWNLVGEFDLPAGEVRVELTDLTDGRMVVADAIAWSPVRVAAQTSDGRTPGADADDPDTASDTEADAAAPVADGSDTAGPAAP